MQVYTGQQEDKNIISVLEEKVTNLQKNKEALGFSINAKNTGSGFFIDIKNLNPKYKKAIDNGVSDIIKMAALVIEDTLYPRYAPKDKAELEVIARMIRENQIALINTLFNCGELAFEALLVQMYSLRRTVYEMEHMSDNKKISEDNKRDLEMCGYILDRNNFKKIA